MMRRPWAEDGARQVVMIAAVLLILTAGFCVFDHHEHGTGDHGMSPDLCAGMLVSSLAMALLGVVLVNAHAVIELTLSVYSVSLHIPDPPPKFRSLA